MQTTNINRVRLSLLTAITVVGGGAWWLSAFYTEMQDFKRTAIADLSEMKGDVKTLLKRAPQVAKACKPVEPCAQLTEVTKPKERDDAQSTD